MEDALSRLKEVKNLENRQIKPNRKEGVLGYKHYRNKEPSDQ